MAFGSVNILIYGVWAVVARPLTSRPSPVPTGKGRSLDVLGRGW